MRSRLQTFGKLMTSDGNHTRIALPSEPDAHGEAALLFVESLLHMLVERSVLSVEDAIAVVQSTAEVKLALANETGQAEEARQFSLNLLFRISDSLAVDLPN